MPRRNPQAEILDRLEAYLGSGAALPATTDNKVNVAALVTALGLRSADAQYFFREGSSIKDAVNGAAMTQDLHPIGYRGEQSRADAVVAGQMARSAERSKRDAQSAVEAKHAYIALAEEHSTALREIVELRQSLETARRRLAAYEALIPFDRLAAEVPLP